MKNNSRKKQQNEKDQNKKEDKNKKESKPIEANGHSTESTISRKSQKHTIDELEDSSQKIDAKSSLQPPKKLTKLDSGVSVEEKTNQNSIISDDDDYIEKPDPKPKPKPEPELEVSTTINLDLVQRKVQSAFTILIENEGFN